MLKHNILSHRYSNTFQISVHKTIWKTFINCCKRDILLIFFFLELSCFYLSANWVLGWCFISTRRFWLIFWTSRVHNNNQDNNHHQQRNTQSKGKSHCVQWFFLFLLTIFFLLYLIQIKPNIGESSRKLNASNFSITSQTIRQHLISFKRSLSFRHRKSTLNVDRTLRYGCKGQ